MERSIFNKTGEAVAYISNDYNQTIYLWDGYPVAYLYEDLHVFGINGKHLGWFSNGILYNHLGERIGFTSSTCPVSIAKEPVKPEKRPADQLRPKWSAPPFPKLSFNLANQELRDFFREGQVVWISEASSTEGPEE